MINVKIVDGKGSGKELDISDEGAANVVVHPHPPLNEALASLPFSSYLLNNDSKDMIVNGSVAVPIEFGVTSSAENDIYIKSITIQISDPGARLDRFGALLELVNGCQFVYRNIKTGTLIISDDIKTNLDLFRDSTGGKNFGSGLDSFRADIQGGGGLDTYFPEMDFSIRFGLPWGLRIKKNSTDTVAFIIRDNLAGLSVFNIKAYGIIT